MTESVALWEQRWRDALASEDLEGVVEAVQAILRRFSETAVAAEIRYQRGLICLEDGEGTGEERLQQAQKEFAEGYISGQAAGEDAEPWRSMNRNQWALCAFRLGETQQAEEALLEVSRLRPRSVVGWESLRLLSEIAAQDETLQKRQKRYESQRLSYLRGLLREHQDSEPQVIHELRFLLAMELCSQERFMEEGQKLLEEIIAEGPAVLGEELYEQVLIFRETQEVEE